MNDEQTRRIGSLLLWGIYAIIVVRVALLGFLGFLAYHTIMFVLKSTGVSQ